MALRVAVASGNWSSPSTWNGGVLPTVGDIVASNTYTVTIDQNINVDTLTNRAQAVVYSNPYMTSNTAPSGIVTASSIPAPSTNDAWRAFDNSSSTWWSGGSLATPQWIAYEYPSSVVVDQYIIQGVNNGNEQGPKDFQFQGWDGTNWITLHTVTGNSSNSYTSPLIGNSTPYIKYRLYVTLGIGTSIGIVNFFFYEYLSISPATAGGGFILNDGVTLNLTNTTGGIIAGPATCVTYSASTGTSTINGIVRGSQTNGNVFGILFSGSAILNINGKIQSGPTSNTNSTPLVKTGSGLLNITGDIIANNGTNAAVALVNSGTGTINITGDIYAVVNSGYGHGMQNNGNCVINITGNIYGGNINAGNSIGFVNTSVANISIVGNIFSGTVNVGVSTSSALYLNIVGSLIAGSTVAVVSTNSSAINLFSGPFICSEYGFMPFQVTRMHLIRTLNNYFEFRDETTNGALSPSPSAPATRLVSPDTVVDAPIPSDVRDGVSYSLGTFTGTLKVPSPNSVSFGVPVDNTVGTAVLTPEDVWNAQTSAMNTDGSIGKRLKNASTVDSTGDQLTSLL